MKNVKQIDTSQGKIWFGEILLEFENDMLSKKQKERKTIDTLLKHIFKNETIELKRTSKGQPYFKNKPNTHLSISHSNNWYAIYISIISEVGIDIQTSKTKIIQGKDYFINDEENRTFDSLTFDEAHIIWCAKEAFFKLKSGNIFDLKNEVSVIEINRKMNVGKLKFKDQISSFSIVLENEFYLIFVD